MAGSEKTWEASDRGGDKSPAAVLESLGDRDWSTRQAAVHELASSATEDSTEQLLAILREGHRDLSRLNAAIQVLARTSVDVVPKLVELLSHAEAEVRTYSALTLGERGDPRAVQGLIRALADSDTNVRMHSVEALGRLRAAAAVDALIEIVESRDFELAFPAIDALIAIGDERIAHRLVPLLQEPLFKLLTAEALGWLGDEEVVKPLLDLLGEADVPAGSVVVALARIHSRYQQRYGDATSIPRIISSLASGANIQTLIASPQFESRTAIGSWAQIVSWLPGPDAELALLNVLDRPPVDAEIVLALARRGRSIVPQVVERLTTVNEQGREAIIEVLTRIGDRSAVPALLEILESAEDELLTRTIDSLARLADLRAYEPLRALLGHASSPVRQSVVAALSSLGHPNVAPDLLLGLRDPSPLVRESCVKVAAYLGLPACIDAVFDSCGDPDERVRRAAIESLPTLDDPRLCQRLQRALRTDTPAVRAAAAAALGKVDDVDTAAKLLYEALTDGDVWVRYFAVRSLCSIQRQKLAIAKLIQLAREDAAVQVRVVAVDALSACGSEALSVLLELSHSPLADLANAAVGSLGAFSHPDARQAILEAIHSHDFDRRLHAIRAIGRVDGSDLIEPLRICLLSGDQRLAEEAAYALSRIRLRESALALIDGVILPNCRESCVSALTTMGDAAVPALAYGLRVYELNTRRAIVEVLARIRTPMAKDALEIALEDAQPAVRHAAFSALAHIKTDHVQVASAEACEGRN